MTTEAIKVNTKNYNFSKLVLEKPIANEKRKNVFSAKLKYLNEKDEPCFFLVETPKLYTPFGANSYNDDGKYNLTTTLSNKDKEKEFKKMIESFQKRVKELIKGLPKSFSKIMNNEFTKMVKPSKEPEKYPPTFTIKLKTNEETGELFANIYNKKKEEITINLENIKTELAKRTKVRGLLMLNTVWFVNKNCGVTVNAKQLMIYPSESTGCQFDDLSDSDEEVEAEVEMEESDDEESDDE